jgi:hypothetical protein
MAPQHLLHPFEVPDRAHSLEGRNLLGVGLDAPLGDDVSYEDQERPGGRWMTAPQ